MGKEAALGAKRPDSLWTLLEPYSDAPQLSFKKHIEKWIAPYETKKIRYQSVN